MAAMLLMLQWFSCQIRKIAGCMRRKCRERFPRHLLKGTRRASDPSTHHGTCVTHVLWCTLGSLTRGGGQNVTDIPGECATRNFSYLVFSDIAYSISSVLNGNISGVCVTSWLKFGCYYVVTTRLDNAATSTPGGYATTTDTRPCL